LQDYKFSIVVNCLNGSRYLDKSINSIIKQKYYNWEIIFWDNCSEDDSLQIIKKFKNDKIKIFKSEKKEKLYHARNRAISKANGDIICFLDVDDWWSPNKLKIYNEAFHKFNCDYIYGNFFNYYEKSLLKYRIYKFLPLPVGFIYNQLAENYLVSLPTLAFKSNCIVDERIIFNSNYNIIGDFDFVMRISKKYKAHYIYIPTAYYRQHPNSYSNLNVDEHIKELSEWSKKTDRVLRSKVNDKIKYLRCLEFINKRLFLHFFKEILKIKNLKNKIKLILIFILK